MNPEQEVPVSSLSVGAMFRTKRKLDICSNSFRRIRFCGSLEMGTKILAMVVGEYDTEVFESDDMVIPII